MSAYPSPIASPGGSCVMECTHYKIDRLFVVLSLKEDFHVFIDFVLWKMIAISRSNVDIVILCWTIVSNFERFNRINLKTC